jgi:hypothetical protein
MRVVGIGARLGAFLSGAHHVARHGKSTGHVDRDPAPQRRLGEITGTPAASYRAEHVPAHVVVLWSQPVRVFAFRISFSAGDSHAV